MIDDLLVSAMALAYTKCYEQALQIAHQAQDLLKQRRNKAQSALCKKIASRLEMALKRIES